MPAPDAPAEDALAVVAAVIRARRTSLQVDPERPVSDDLLDQLVELATWAPNHKRTWPWRFTILTGEGRSRFGDALAAAAPGLGVPAAGVAKLRTKYRRSPVVLVLWSTADDDPVRHEENRDAVAAATQNLLLAATAAGLASHWASVLPALHPVARHVCGVGPADELVALVYLGWPTGEVPAPERPAPEVTRIDAG